MVRVLIVEGPNARLAELHYVLASDPQIELVGFVRSAEQALTVAARRQPELVLIGLEGQTADGLTVIRTIANGYHAPIIVLDHNAGGSEFQPPPELVEAGAQALLPYPPRADHPGHPLAVRRLLDTIKLIAEIKVVRRRRHTAGRSAAVAADGFPPTATRPARVIAIGASTGGPAVLRTILSRLPAEFRIPVLVVQHMAQGFIADFATWIAGSTACRVELAQEGICVSPGVIYIGPDDRHLGITGAGRIQLSSAPPEHGMRPSVSYLFRSVLDSFGADSAGVLLTGMGKDGAAELKSLKAVGALTLIQDRASSAVYGMAGEAFKLDAASAVLDPVAIGDALASLGTRR